MKRIYYEGGPAVLSAGQAGRFTRGKARPVSDALAAALLGRKDVKFRVATKDTPLDESINQAEAEKAALDQDKAAADQAAAEKKAAAEKAAAKKEEVSPNV